MEESLSSGVRDLSTTLEMTNHSMSYHAALAHFPKISYNRYQKLAAYFSDLPAGRQDLKNLWDAEINELIQAGIDAGIASEFLAWREKNPIEKMILDILDEKTELTIDEIIRIAGLETSQVLATISMLEIRGRIKKRSGKYSLTYSTE